MLYLNESLCTVTEIFTTVTFDILEIDFDHVTEGCDYADAVTNLAKLLEGKVTADDMPMDNHESESKTMQMSTSTITRSPNRINATHM